MEPTKRKKLFTLKEESFNVSSSFLFFLLRDFDFEQEEKKVK